MLFRVLIVFLFTFFWCKVLIVSVSALMSLMFWNWNVFWLFSFLFFFFWHCCIAQEKRILTDMSGIVSWGVDEELRIILLADECKNKSYTHTYIYIYIYIYIYKWYKEKWQIYIYIYIYISNILSASKDNGCGLFMHRIYEEFHINLWECSMYGYCYIFPIQVYIINLTYRLYSM